MALLFISVFCNRFLDIVAVLFRSIMALFLRLKVTLGTLHIIGLCLIDSVTNLFIMSGAFLLIFCVAFLFILCSTFLFILCMALLIILSLTLLLWHLVALLFWYRFSLWHLYSVTLLSRNIVNFIIINSITL